MRRIQCAACEVKFKFNPRTTKKCPACREPIPEPLNHNFDSIPANHIGRPGRVRT